MRKRIMIFLAAALLLLTVGCGKEKTSVVDPFAAFDQETIAEVEGISGGMLLQSKQFAYGSCDVVILRVTNQTEADCDITVRLEFFDSAGEKIQTDAEVCTQTFTGFSAGWQNYLLFDPNIPFEDYSCSLTASPHEGETYAKYIRIGDAVEIVDLREVFEDSGVSCNFPMQNTYSEALYYTGDLILFDNSGEIYQIENSKVKKMIDATGEKEFDYKSMQLSLTGELPEELQGTLTGLTAIKQVEPMDQTNDQ